MSQKTEEQNQTINDQMSVYESKRSVLLKPQKAIKDNR